jgi:type VI secretion system secreted protein Hcp
MAVDYYLKIDGIPGESTDTAHRGEINILNWSWSETLSAGPVTGGGGAGKVSMQDFHASKVVDKASAKLMLACTNGQHIKNAVLSCRKAGGGPDFLTITFTDAIVSSYEVAGNSGAADPTDQFSLHFAKIEFK